MNNRINLLLQAKNITAKQFAEEIGVQPSGMSHIMSGRNNPSLDFVMKVVKRYPEVNIYWLMFGKGEMYDTGNVPAPVISAEPNNELDLFSSQGFSPMGERLNNDVDAGTMIKNPSVSKESVDIRTTQKVQEQPKESSKTPQIGETAVSSHSSTNDYNTSQVQHPVVNQQGADKAEGSNLQSFPHENRSDESVQGNGAVRRKRIVKFIVLYDDHSFSEYYPEG